MKKKLCFLVCNNWINDFRQVATEMSSEGEYDIEVRIFPSWCHTRKRHHQFFLNIDSQDLRKTYQQIFIFGGQCLKELVQKKDEDFVHFHSFDLCQYWVCSPSMVDQYIQMGFYILTSGWVANWRNYIEQWGFDEVTGREFFREFCRGLMLLDTGIYSESQIHLAEMADFTGMPAERVLIGMEYLSLKVGKIISAWVEKKQQSKFRQDLIDIRRMNAQNAMAIDLIYRFISMKNEREILDSVMSFAEQFFAPAQLVLFTGKDKSYREILAWEAGQRRLGQSDKQVSFRSDDSLMLDISNGESSWRIGIYQVALPQYLSQYQEIGGIISELCSLVIENLRIGNELRGRLDLATTVQRNLLMGDYHDQRIEIRTIYSPFDFVSGDFYSYFWRDKNVLCGYVLDITGHGIAAALRIHAVSATIAWLINQGWTLNSGLLEKINKEVCLYFDDETFAALLIFEINLMDKQITVSSGGIGQFWIRSADKYSRILVPGSYVGMMEEAEYTIITQPIQAGDSFYFLTDGISERLKESECDFRNLEHTVQQLHRLSIDPERWDDCTALCIQIKPCLPSGRL